MIFRPKRQSAAFVKEAAQVLSDAGYGYASIFRGTGFTRAVLAEEDTSADGAAIAQFFEHAADLKPDLTFGFSLGQQCSLKEFGLWGYLALTAPDVAGALEQLAQYSSLVFSDATWLCTLQEDCVELSWRMKAASDDVISSGRTDLPSRRQYDEFLTSLILSNLRMASQHRLTPNTVTFVHDQHAGTMSQFAEYFGCKPSFGATRNSINVAAVDMRRALVSTETKLNLLLREYAKHLTENGLENGLVQQVEQAITARLSLGSATLAEVADDLGMSARSLSRKLAAKDQSFFSILERLRHDLAMQYLFHSDLVLAEIAHALGYSGLSSFNDAFKRWTGQSPGQYRQRRDAN